MGSTILHTIMPIVLGGMGGVFGVIILIWASIVIITKVFK